MSGQLGEGHDPLDGIDGTTTVNNPYHYTNNDPINTTDPTGLRPGDWEFADPCAGPGEDGDGSRPFSELTGFGFYSSISQDRPSTDERGCVALPNAASNNGSLPIPWGAVPGPDPYPAVSNPEAEVCRQHPFECRLAHSIKSAAELEEAGRWGHAPEAERWNEPFYRYLGQTNAFKHMLWSALLAVVLGRDSAELWAHAHEVGGPVSDQADQMDRANNFYGFRMGESFGCVCLNAGETMLTSDIDGEIRRLAASLRPHVAREVDAGRACWLENPDAPRLKQGCG